MGEQKKSSPFIPFNITWPLTLHWGIQEELEVRFAKALLVTLRLKMTTSKER